MKTIEAWAVVDLVGDVVQDKYGAPRLAATRQEARMMCCTTDLPAPVVIVPADDYQRLRAIEKRLAEAAERVPSAPQ